MSDGLDHSGREAENWREDVPDEAVDFLDALEEAAADENCDVDGCLKDARHTTPTDRVLCPGHWKMRRGEQAVSETEHFETCQECSQSYNPDREGYYVDTDDVGPEATGGTAEVFRQDAENFGEWLGFKEEDIGPWCEDCSWKIQRRRTRNDRELRAGTEQSGGPQ